MVILLAGGEEGLGETEGEGHVVELGVELDGVLGGGVEVGEAVVDAVGGEEGGDLRGEFGELGLEGLLGEFADLEGLCRLEESS